MGFLLKLQTRAGELLARFNAVKATFLERVQTEEGRRSLLWTLQSQLDEYQLWPTTPHVDETI